MSIENDSQPFWETCRPNFLKKRTKTAGDKEERTNTLHEIAWNCKNCAGLFKHNLLVSSKFTTQWKTIQKMDGN